MYSQFSEESKAVFLLEFTKQLIRNSASIDVYKLIELVRQKEEKIKERKIEEKREIKELVKEKIKEREDYFSSIKENEGEEFLEGKNPFKKMFPKKLGMRNIQPRRALFIPEPVLPERLQYLKPIPTHKEIDLGEINPLVQDPIVNVIECDGSGKSIVVNGTMGTKETGVILTEEEINEIINKFSQETKIPLHEGLFKAVIGQLMISAIYSESGGSKFIIKKMPNIPQRSPPMLRGQMQFR